MVLLSSCVSKSKILTLSSLFLSRDNVTAGVVEPAISKIKSLRFATEAAITILRIDDLIKVSVLVLCSHSYYNHELLHFAQLLFISVTRELMDLYKFALCFWFCPQLDKKPEQQVIEGLHQNLSSIIVYFHHSLSYINNRFKGSKSPGRWWNDGRNAWYVRITALPRKLQLSLLLITTSNMYP